MYNLHGNEATAYTRGTVALDCSSGIYITCLHVLSGTYAAVLLEVKITNKFVM